MSIIEEKELIINDSSDLINILNSRSKALTILNYSCSYWEENYIHSEILSTQEAIYEYILENIKNNDMTKEEHIEVQKYISLLCEYLVTNPTFIHSNPIFKLDKQTLLDFISEDTYSYIIYLRNNNLNKAKILYNKFMRDKNSISEQELKFIIKYFLNNIENEENELNLNQEHLIYKLLNSDRKYNSVLIKVYILKYLTYQKSKELGYIINLYFCDDEFKGKYSDSLGLSDENNIYINNSIFKNCLINKLYEFEEKRFKSKRVNESEENSFYDLIVTLYHEIAHCKQFFDEIDNKKTLEAISEIEYLLFSEKFGYDEYKKNYKYYENELIAEITAYDDTILFSETFMPKYYEKIKEKSINKKEKVDRKKSYSYKKDHDGIKYINEYYIVENLNEIILNNPNLIDDYEQLTEFYTKEGKLKSLGYLLLHRMDYMAKQEDYNIFDKFIIYYIQKGDLGNLNISDYSYNQRYDILLSLDNILTNLVKDIYNIKNSYDEDNDLKKYTPQLLIRKLKLIKRVEYFLKNNIGEFKSFLRNSEESMKLLNNILSNFTKKANINLSKVSVDDIMNETKIRNIR